MGKHEENADGEIYSVIPPLELPQFQPRIPGHLMEKLHLRDREMLTTMNVMAQHQDWVTPQFLLLHKFVREQELRIQKLERWRMILVSKWSLFAYLVLACVPFLLSKLFEKLWK